MAIKVICSYSALSLWLDGTGRQDIKEEMTKAYRKLPDRFSPLITRDELESLAESFNLTYPIHLNVRRTSPEQVELPCVFHLLSKCVPTTSYIQLSSSIYLASPELCLLQVANDFSIHQLVVIINKLCATYYVDRNSPMQQQNRMPVTTLGKIRSLLNVSQGAHGVRKLTRAVQYAVEKCNSPIETAIAAIVCLPFSLGGYNIPAPTMNASIKLNAQGAEILGRDRCRPDISWKLPRKVAIEYDSNLSHLTISQHSEDKKRYNALSASGYEVRTIVADQLRNFETIESFFLEIRRLLGLNKRTSFLNKNVKIRREVMYDLFLGK